MGPKGMAEPLVARIEAAEIAGSEASPRTIARALGALVVAVDVNGQDSRGRMPQGEMSRAGGLEAA